MRILLAAYGTRGDVQPMVAIGRRLRADGHEVVLGAAPGFAAWVRGHGLEFRTIGADIEALIHGFGPELTLRPARLTGRLLQSLREETELSFGQTLEAARDADLIVAGIHPAAASVAEVLEVPMRPLLFCPQMIRSAHHPPPGLPWFRLPGPANRLLWWAMSRLLHGAMGTALNRHRRRHGLVPVADMLSHLVGARPIVCSDALLGGLPPDAPPGVEQIGSLALPADGALDPALERFLDRGEPPVCIGFGSMPDGDPRRTTRLLFEALERCGRRGVVLSGWARLGDEQVPPGVFVTPRAPHAALLPRVAALVHHGGAGTTAAAARAGLPQVVVPFFVDQIYWAREVHRRGLGSRPIPRPRLTAERLADAIDEALGRPAIREQARRVQLALAHADGVAALADRLYAAVGAGDPRAAA